MVPLQQLEKEAPTAVAADVSIAKATAAETLSTRPRRRCLRRGPSFRILWSSVITTTMVLYVAQGRGIAQRCSSISLVVARTVFVSASSLPSVSQSHHHHHHHHHDQHFYPGQTRSLIAPQKNLPFHRTIAPGKNSYSHAGGGEPIRLFFGQGMDDDATPPTRSMEEEEGELDDEDDGEDDFANDATTNTKTSRPLLSNHGAQQWWSIHRGGSSQRRTYSTNDRKKNDAKKAKRPNHAVVAEGEEKKEDDDGASSTVSSSLTIYSSLPSQKRFFKRMRQGMGNVLSGVGFVTSSAVSLVKDRRSFKDRFSVPLESLRTFLQKSGVDMELSAALNRRLGTNVCLLGRVNMYQTLEEQKVVKDKDRKGKRGTKSRSGASSSSSSSSDFSSKFWEEARRYMRYATAVYGQAMVYAADVDARGKMDGKFDRVTRDVIGGHISVPPEDIALMDVDYDGDSSHLRHFIAVDHENQKVVLSIRGTFSLTDIVLDVAGFSREFCGGEAHSEIANMAERVWSVAGPTVLQSLEEHKGYEFIITGHSLGAGAACLLTILLETKDLLPKSQQMRCFAYASPPVYTPLEFVPKASSLTTNFVHQNDAVPFLSIDSVRHLFCSLCAVDGFSQTDMTRNDRYKVILGMKDVPLDLVGAVVETKGKPIEPKEGAPVLFIPAHKTIWLKCDDPSEEGDYHYSTLNSRELVNRGIRVHPDMLLDHFPPRYEHAFDHLVE